MTKVNDILTAAYVWLTNRVKADEGQGLVEYALIIALVAIALIAALQFLGGGIQNVFGNIGNALNDATQ